MLIWEPGYVGCYVNIKSYRSEFDDQSFPLINASDSKFQPCYLSMPYIIHNVYNGPNIIMTAILENYQLIN